MKVWRSPRAYTDLLYCRHPVTGDTNLRSLHQTQGIPFPKDLVIYDSDKPPDDYSLDLEVESLVSAADQAGLERFHLVGYSVGGTIALLCAEQHGPRVESLVLFEPTLISGEQTERILAAPPTAGIQMMLRPGAPLPPLPSPTGAPPPWMAKRLGARVPTFHACRDATARLGPGLRGFTGAVLYFLGADSNPEFFDPNQVGNLVPHMDLHVFAGCSHPNPPFRAVPDKVVLQLQEFWSVAAR